MSGIVVDASITLSWCFPDEQTKLSTQVLDRLKAGEVAIVPAFWVVEVLNTLLVGEKRGRISPAQTQSFLADLRAWGQRSIMPQWSRYAGWSKPSAAISV